MSFFQLDIDDVHILKHYYEFIELTGFSEEKIKSLAEGASHWNKFRDSPLNGAVVSSDYYAPSTSGYINLQNYVNNTVHTVDDFPTLSFAFQVSNSHAAITSSKLWKDMRHNANGPSSIKKSWVGQAKVPTQYSYNLYNIRMEKDEYDGVHCQAKINGTPLWLETFRNKKYIDETTYMSFVKDIESFDDLPIEWVFKAINFRMPNNLTHQFTTICEFIDLERSSVKSFELS